MEQSPLSQQARPDTFKPKVVGLYEFLLKDDEDPHRLTEGFWRELFLLKPDLTSLRQLLSGLSTQALLHHAIPTQEIFARCTEAIRAGHSPEDENALATLTAFLESILSKRYTSPSADVISILAGLEGVDWAFANFVSALDFAIRDGKTQDIRQKAVRAAMAAVGGAYQTGLVSYFLNRDLFPSLMKLVQDVDDPHLMYEPCTLLGLLVNYNKFEFQNPYQLRLEDFVDDSTIHRMMNGIGTILLSSRNAYLNIQDDLTEGWSFASTLTYFGLGGLITTSRTAAANLSEEDMKVAFASMPPPQVAVLLATYDFVNANKIFCYNFVTPFTEKGPVAPAVDNFISFASYLFQNAYRSARAASYSCLILIIFRILVEDQSVAKNLGSTEQLANVRLCRQRQPLLPVARNNRVRMLIILDVLIDGINHNLRRRLDVELYILFFEPLLRILTTLSRSRIRLTYHWGELWRSLLSFMRFLNAYANDLKPLPRIHRLADSLVNVLAISLSSGEAFLPDARSYDDLFYKVFESGEALVKFRDSFDMSKRKMVSGSIEILMSVSGHYTRLLDEKKGKGNMNVSPREVREIIKQGYETLSIESREGLDHWNRYREADHRNLIKKVTKVVIQDVRALLAQGT
ncbi:MAG: hypothetical protein M1831_002277 [Alyxoria varia]|nr:MAG: hypothetical protein M1831_002277 [Alyxoria varia]